MGRYAQPTVPLQRVDAFIPSPYGRGVGERGRYGIVSPSSVTLLRFRVGARNDVREEVLMGKLFPPFPLRERGRERGLYGIVLPSSATLLRFRVGARNDVKAEVLMDKLFPSPTGRGCPKDRRGWKVVKE